MKQILHASPILLVFITILSLHATTEQKALIALQPSQDHIENYTRMQKSPFFTICIYAYNTENWIKKNLDSVFSQHYKNYRILYIDDASYDATTNTVQKYISTTSAQHIKIITNTEHQGELKTLYSIINNCADDEIIILLNGNDWLAHNKVLTELGAAYNSNDIWLTYGTCTSAPKGCNISIRNGSIPQHILEHRLYRDIFPYMPVRSFYAWLFKLIKKDDLIDASTGDFFEHAAECYIMWPLLEMAHNHFKAISSTTYVINSHDPIAQLEKDYHLRMAINSQMDKNIPIYPLAIKPNC
ncbi:MAG: glycosyltransferase family A protein [Candidatus Babeliales bacterium]